MERGCNPRKRKDLERIFASIVCGTDAMDLEPILHKCQALSLTSVLIAIHRRRMQTARDAKDVETYDGELKRAVESCIKGSNANVLGLLEAELAKDNFPGLKKSLNNIVTTNASKLLKLDHDRTVALIADRVLGDVGDITIDEESLVQSLSDPRLQFAYLREE